MSRKRKKNRGERVICPICFDEDPNNKIELTVQKGIYKVSHHPIVIRKDKIEIDFGFIFFQDAKHQTFILKCPKCKVEQKYDSPDKLIEELEPLVEYMIAHGAFEENHSLPVNSKFLIKRDIKETLPKIVRISENDDTYVH